MAASEGDERFESFFLRRRVSAVLLLQRIRAGIWFS